MSTKDEPMLTQFEHAVLAKLLDGDHPALPALRAQLRACKVTGREATGHGFFTNLSVDRGVEPVPGAVSRMRIADVGADIEGLEHGAGFVLFVTDGFMDFLEGYSYGESWPKAIDGFSLRFEGARVDDPGAISSPDA